MVSIIKDFDVYVSAALEGLRKRKGNLTMSTDHKMASKMIGFEIEPGEEVVTDQAKDGAFQKAVKFTKDFLHLVTAGADGCLRIWKVRDDSHTTVTVLLLSDIS